MKNIYSSFSNLINKFQYFMFDADGVLWSGGKLINNSG